LIAFAAEKPSFFFDAICIVSPVAGLRPSRAADVETLNLPKPLTATSSPLAAASAIAAKTASTAFLPSAFDRPSELQRCQKVRRDSFIYLL
jgi:hypothetical protein